MINVFCFDKKIAKKYWNYFSIKLFLFIVTFIVFIPVYLTIKYYDNRSVMFICALFMIISFLFIVIKFKNTGELTSFVIKDNKVFMINYRYLDNIEYGHMEVDRNNKFLYGFSLLNNTYQRNSNKNKDNLLFNVIGVFNTGKNVSDSSRHYKRYKKILSDKNKVLDLLNEDEYNSNVYSYEIVKIYSIDKYFDRYVINCDYKFNKSMEVTKNKIVTVMKSYKNIDLIVDNLNNLR